MTSLHTFQQCHRYVPNEKPNDIQVERRQQSPWYVSLRSSWNFVTTSQQDLTMTSHQYSRVLNNRACTINFFQSNFFSVRSLLGNIRLFFWTKYLPCIFILHYTSISFEHFFQWKWKKSINQRLLKKSKKSVITYTF